MNLDGRLQKRGTSLPGLIRIMGLWGMYIALFGCNLEYKDEKTSTMERQITRDNYGHFLNPFQAFSPDDACLVYDTRNDDTHIGRTGRVERVHVDSQIISPVYTVPGQIEYGPGVGAVAWSPVEDQVIMIHGLANANASRPYGITRRTGVGVMTDRPDELIRYDARKVDPPFVPGALRGGSHAHSWSRDGKAISFTYNDAVIESLAQRQSGVEDLRTVGVMMPWGPVEVISEEKNENFSGTMFSMIVAQVTENPVWGTDDISKAYEESWIGHEGYKNEAGEQIRYALAFLGDVRSNEGKTVTEVFVVDIPGKLPNLEGESRITGDEHNRPQPPSVIRQRRVTFTADRKYPGVAGPRQWMKSSPDGSELYFMMKDDEGRVQIFSVPTNGGDILQRTHHEFSITTSFDLDPSGRYVAYGVGEEIFLTDLHDGQTRNLTPEVSPELTDLRAIQWSHNGDMLAYNRKVSYRDSAYFQIFTLKVHHDL